MNKETVETVKAVFNEYMQYEDEKMNSPIRYSRLLSFTEWLDRQAMTHNV